MTTKQSIHEEFHEKLANKHYIEAWGVDFEWEDIESFYDTKIQQLLEEIVPGEKNLNELVNKIVSRDNTASPESVSIYWGNFGKGFNQAIAEIKQKIKEVGY